MKRRVVIIGAGIAGIAAAIRLAEADEQPILIETRKKLGGRATSFVDSRTGEEVDNCQHVVLGCCTHLLDLYARLDVLDAIEWHRTLYWCAGEGRVDEMRAGALPAPFHLTQAFRSLSCLSRSQRGEISKAMWRIIRMKPASRFALRDTTFSTFLDECGQSQGARVLFWDPIIVSACNLLCNRVNAAYALKVIAEGFLDHRWAYTMGVPGMPLARLYDAAHDVLLQAGGEIQYGVSARGISFDGARVRGVVTDKGLIDGAATIAAVPPNRLGKLISHAMREADSRLTHLGAFKFSPILGVHLFFDQPILELPHLILPGRDVQWLFNKGVNASGRQHLHAVISGADDWMNLTEPEIIDRVMEDVYAALPNARGLQPQSSRSIKEKHATFAATPGVDDIRPSVTPGPVGLSGGGIQNLFLAGDWCDTGWPATMEGAARSGYEAAGAVLDRDLSVSDLPRSFISNWLACR